MHVLRLLLLLVSASIVAVTATPTATPPTASPKVLCYGDNPYYVEFGYANPYCLTHHYCEGNPQCPGLANWAVEQFTWLDLVDAQAEINDAYEENHEHLNGVAALLVSWAQHRENFNSVARALSSAPPAVSSTVTAVIVVAAMFVFHAAILVFAIAQNEPGTYNDKFYEYGGSLFCCLRDMPSCCFGVFCPRWQLAEASAEASGGSCVNNYFQLCCFPILIGPACVAGDMSTGNVRWGGKAHCFYHFLCICFCPHLTSMQVARAVKGRKGWETAQLNAVVRDHQQAASGNPTRSIAGAPTAFSSRFISAGDAVTNADATGDVALAEALVAFYASRPEAVKDAMRPASVTDAFRLVRALGVADLARRLRGAYAAVPPGFDPSLAEEVTPPPAVQEKAAAPASVPEAVVLGAPTPGAAADVVAERAHVQRLAVALIDFYAALPQRSLNPERPRSASAAAALIAQRGEGPLATSLLENYGNLPEGWSRPVSTLPPAAPLRRIAEGIQGMFALVVSEAAAFAYGTRAGLGARTAASRTEPVPAPTVPAPIVDVEEAAAQATEPKDEAERARVRRLAESLIAFYATRPRESLNPNRPRTASAAVAVIMQYGEDDVRASLMMSYGELPEGW